MTKNSRLTVHLALAILSVIAYATPALADDPAPPADEAAAEPPDGEETESKSMPEESAEGTESKAMLEEPAEEPAAEPAASRYPRTVFLRPLTLPAGLVMAGADFIANKDFKSILGAPILGYGITDKLEVQVPYVFALREFEAKGILDVDAGFVLLRGAVGGRLEVVARVRGGYNLLLEEARPLFIGAHAAFNLTDKIVLISGIPSQQQFKITLSGDVKPIDFSLPIGIGVQVNPLLFLQLDTKLAQIKISDSANAFIGSDTTPVSLTATYNAIPRLDVLANVFTDLSNTPGDSLLFLLGVRYYAGAL